MSGKWRGFFFSSIGLGLASNSWLLRSTTLLPHSFSPYKLPHPTLYTTFKYLFRLSTFLFFLPFFLFSCFLLPFLPNHSASSNLSTDVMSFHSRENTYRWRQRMWITQACTGVWRTTTSSRQMNTCAHWRCFTLLPPGWCRTRWGRRRGGDWAPGWTASWTVSQRMSLQSQSLNLSICMLMRSVHACAFSPPDRLSNTRGAVGENR